MRPISIVLFFCPLWAGAISIVTDHTLRPTCSSNNGVIQAAAVGGIPPYTYLWSDGATLPATRSDLAAGFYSLTVTDSNGDSAMESWNLTAIQNLDGVTISNNLNGQDYFPCPGQSNGIVVLAVEPNPAQGWYGVNAVAPYSINVMIDGSPIALGGADNYGNPWYPDIYANGLVSFSITDAAGCIGQGGNVILGPGAAGAWTTGVTDACASGNNGAIQFGVASDFLGFLGRLHVRDDQGVEVFVTPPFADPVEATGLASGTYSVEITYGISPNFTCAGEMLDPVTIGDLGSACGTVEGTLFIDNDQDCLQGPAEVSVPYRVLEIMPGPQYAITDATGHYARDLVNGAYTLDVTGADLFPLCPATMPTPFSINSNTVIVDLADSSTVPLDMFAGAYAQYARPGFQQNVYLSAQNRSAQLSGALETTLIFDPQLSFVSATPTPISVIGNTVVWNSAALTAYANTSYQVVLQVPADISLLGLPWSHNVTISQPLPEADLTNNTSTITGVFTSSFDPNDITAYTSTRQSATEYFIGQDAYIDHVIRFQNTGTDTAFNVVVTDTMDVDLDLATFEQGQVSHPFSVSFKPNRVVEWRFENILLPDSNTNEAESHGLIAFRINPKQPVLPGTEYRSAADIYFDFNPPVRTNDAVLVATMSTSIPRTAPNAWTVAPNPVKDVLRIRLGDTNDRLEHVELWSMDGRLVHSDRAMNAVTELDLSALPAGPYVLKARTSNGAHNASVVMRE